MWRRKFPCQAIIPDRVKKSQEKKVTFGENLNNTEYTNEILEILENGDKISQNEIDFNLEDVQNQLK